MRRRSCSRLELDAKPPAVHCTAGGCLSSIAVMDDEPLKVPYVRFHIGLDRKYRQVRFPAGNG